MNGAANKFFKWLESRVDPFDIEDISLKNTDTINVLFQFIKKVKKYFILLLIIGMVVSLTDVFLYMFIGNLVDNLLKVKTNDNELYVMTIVGLTIFVIRVTFGLINSLLAEQVIQANFSPMVRWRMNREILTKNIKFFNQEFSGNISSKVWQSGQAASEFMMSLIQIIWSNVIFFISVFIIFITIDWKLSLIIVIWITTFLVVAYKLIPLTKIKAKNTANAANEFNGHMVDVYSHISTVKLFDGESNDEYFLKGKLETFIKRGKSFLRLISVSKTILLFLGSLAILSTGFISIVLWKFNQISVGEIAMVLGLVLRIDSQLSTLFGLMTGMFRAFGSFQSSIQILDKSKTLNEDKDTDKPFKFDEGKIEFKNVCFSYQDKNIINNVSLSINKGEKIGIVGESGSGKSTIANLILGFYPPSSGEILIDNQNIIDLKKSTLRRYIGCVTQDVALLYRSVYDNITFGKNDFNNEDVVRAAAKAHISEFISTLKDSNGRSGMDAFIGERGVQLSGGQRQRIAMARVLLRNSPIIILDEATSALDSKLDNKIQGSLLEIMPDKTVIVIAHRMATIINMDKILVLEKGEIIGFDSHKNLLRHNAVYCEMWKSYKNKSI